MVSLNNAKRLSANPLIRFFDVYFKKMPQVILINILFFVCSIPAIIIQLLLYKLLGRINVITLLLYIPLVSPFCGGLILLSKKLVCGEPVEIVKDFFNAVKKNIALMSINGVVTFLALVVEYFALMTYYYLAHNNSAYWAAFILSVILGVFVLFCLYTIPLMTVTVDIKLKNIYKNAALLTVGAIKKNFLATLVLAFFFMVSASICLMFGGIASIIVTILFAILIAPATVCIIISFNLFPKIQSDIIDKSKEKVSQKNTVQNDEIYESKLVDIPAGLLEGDPDEFVFYNGRMYKRSVLAEKTNKADIN